MSKIRIKLPLYVHLGLFMLAVWAFYHFIGVEWAIVFGVLSVLGWLFL